MYLVVIFRLYNAFFRPQFQFISPRSRFRCNLTVSCCSSDSLWIVRLIQWTAAFTSWNLRFILQFSQPLLTH